MHQKQRCKVDDPDILLAKYGNQLPEGAIQIGNSIGVGKTFGSENRFRVDRRANRDRYDIQIDIAFLEAPAEVDDRGYRIRPIWRRFRIGVRSIFANVATGCQIAELSFDKKPAFTCFDQYVAVADEPSGHGRAFGPELVLEFDIPFGARAREEKKRDSGPLCPQCVTSTPQQGVCNSRL